MIVISFILEVVSTEWMRISSVAAAEKYRKVTKQGNWLNPIRWDVVWWFHGWPNDSWLAAWWITKTGAILRLYNPAIEPESMDRNWPEVEGQGQFFENDRRLDGRQHGFSLPLDCKPSANSSPVSLRAIPVNRSWRTHLRRAMAMPYVRVPLHAVWMLWSRCIPLPDAKGPL